MTPRFSVPWWLVLVCALFGCEVHAGSTPILTRIQDGSYAHQPDAYYVFFKNGVLFYKMGSDAPTFTPLPPGTTEQLPTGTAVPFTLEKP